MRVQRMERDEMPARMIARGEIQMEIMCALRAI